MNGCDSLICLVGFWTLIFAQTAIAETNILDQNTSANGSDIDVVRGCADLPEGIAVQAKSSKATANSRNIASKPPAKFRDLTPAKLWWAAEQFDPFEGKLVQNWLTHPRQKEINLVVNWQLWTLLDYLGRYRFVNQFGTVAREYGYTLNIFNQKEQCLAVYKYNAVSNPPKWELHLEKLGQDSLQVKPVEFERLNTNNE